MHEQRRDAAQSNEGAIVDEHDLIVAQSAGLKGRGKKKEGECIYFFR